jgi:hypothetical protein
MSAKSERKKQQKKAEEAAQSLPGHTKASRVYDAFREQQQQKLASMASLSQAAMEWANMLR